ncbi:MAG: ATP-dependent helicase [Candidatus Edwardsbacteria bacterium]|nr:ATP-dependent helicase [Candidatus Edwardsbacteria bacterium]MBU1577268.1 ATP-dependent helicase [Candidatus Edwardsbacteria bacterium]MBU2462817.1 ATP-dependent helicase [Candidatus Edwardsbacteria bacterium]MBU2594869.1 ATP-dependent helicase [Candidatus Edwardsbacteria bacterium]
MKILLAGPGTGKTTKIKSIITEQYDGCKNIVVLSFTNATVKDLNTKFSKCENVTCMTLHSFALKYNHLPELHILIKEEQNILKWIAGKLKIDFDTICEILHCITFNKMILACLAFIKSNSAYFVDKLGKLDLLVVDEFQDFNPVEQNFVLQLSKIASETIILGDDDQSIYGFKDADPDGIISLYKNENVEKIQHENLCYRCPDNVVDYAVRLIKINKNRIPKKWLKTSKGGLVNIVQHITQEESDDYILDKIKTICRSDLNASILLLSAVGFSVDALKNKLIDKGIEFVDFWHNDLDEEKLVYIWWLNLFYGDKKTLFLLLLLKHYKALQKKKNLTYFKDKIEKDFDVTAILSETRKFNELPSNIARHITAPPNFDTLAKELPVFERFREYLNLNDLPNSVKTITKRMRNPIEFIDNKVNIMSIHKSKGLEADYVIINGLITGILPNETKGVDTIEAQRRLLFVGITRAKKELDLISTVEWEAKDAHKVDFKEFRFNYKRKKYNAKTSKFIEEISL